MDSSEEYSDEPVIGLSFNKCFLSVYDLRNLQSWADAEHFLHKR